MVFQYDAIVDYEGHDEEQVGFITSTSLADASGRLIGYFGEDNLMRYTIEIIAPENFIVLDKEHKTEVNQFGDIISANAVW